MPFVSLIIPVYNAEKYLRRCLTSAMEQTFKDMEILVVNDGSTDESLAICQEYAQMDPRFHIINKENTGVSDSRNRAIQIAKGDYLQFMDSDDWLTPDATETFVYAAQKFNCDLVIADFYPGTGTSDPRTICHLHDAGSGRFLLWRSLEQAVPPPGNCRQPSGNGCPDALVRGFPV